MSPESIRLAGAWRALQNTWQITREGWPDMVGQQFESEYWERYMQVVPAALRAIDDLKSVEEQVLRETRLSR